MGRGAAALASDCGMFVADYARCDNLQAPRGRKLGIALFLGLDRALAPLTPPPARWAYDRGWTD
jgi:hypothetical protein